MGPVERTYHQNYVRANNVGPNTCIVVFHVELVGEHSDPLFQLCAGGLEGGEARTQPALLGLVLTQQVLQHLLSGLLNGRELFTEQHGCIRKLNKIN